MTHLTLTPERYAEIQARNRRAKNPTQSEEVMPNAASEISGDVKQGAAHPKHAVSAIEEQMAQQIALCKLPEPVRQFRWYPARRWKLDFAWPKIKLAVEVQGNIHRIKQRFKDFFERHYALTFAGWKVLYVGGDDVRSGRAVAWLEQLLQQAQDRDEARGHR